MKIVVDVNRIIAALLKDNTSRKILMNTEFEFFTPEYTFYEIEKHKPEFIKKMKIDEEEFDMVLTMILENVKIVSSLKYRHLLEECKGYIADINDVPFLAACIAIKADGIWSHDTHFRECKKIRTYTNTNLVRKNSP
jgi:predicted nucleic acid-binding protein